MNPGIILILVGSWVLYLHGISSKEQLSRMQKKLVNY